MTCEYINLIYRLKKKKIEIKEKNKREENRKEKKLTAVKKQLMASLPFCKICFRFIDSVLLEQQLIFLRSECTFEPFLFSSVDFEVNTLMSHHMYTIFFSGNTFTFTGPFLPFLFFLPFTLLEPFSIWKIKRITHI